MSSIADSVRHIMAAVFKLPEARIDDTASPETLDAWDSMQHLNLILALEQHFGVQFSVDEMGALADYPSVVALVSQRLQLEPAAPAGPAS